MAHEKAQKRLATSSTVFILINKYDYVVGFHLRHCVGTLNVLIRVMRLSELLFNFYFIIVIRNIVTKVFTMIVLIYIVQGLTVFYLLSSLNMLQIQCSKNDYVKQVVIILLCPEYPDSKHKLTPELLFLTSLMFFVAKLKSIEFVLFTVIYINSI